MATSEANRLEAAMTGRGGLVPMKDRLEAVARSVMRRGSGLGSIGFSGNAGVAGRGIGRGGGLASSSSRGRVGDQLGLVP